GGPRVRVLRRPPPRRAAGGSVAPLAHHLLPLAGRLLPVRHLHELGLQPLELGLVRLLGQLLQPAGQEVLLPGLPGLVVVVLLSTLGAGFLLATHGRRSYGSDPGADHALRLGEATLN